MLITQTANYDEKQAPTVCSVETFEDAKLASSCGQNHPCTRLGTPNVGLLVYAAFSYHLSVYAYAQTHAASTQHPKTCTSHPNLATIMAAHVTLLPAFEKPRFNAGVM